MYTIFIALIDLFSPCNINNGGCSYICKTSAGNQVEYVCPSGQQLKLANDRRMCVYCNDDNANDEVGCSSRIYNGISIVRNFDVEIVALYHILGYMMVNEIGINGTDEPADCLSSNRACPTGLWECDNDL
ncbi:unnamed protein product [Rotaria sp. Silwood1]|nr:unnamed protein product [Rotaria sp. Silwood1]